MLEVKSEQFADAVRHLLLNMPGVGSSLIAEDEELMLKELA